MSQNAVCEVLRGQASAWKKIWQHASTVYPDFCAAHKGSAIDIVKECIDFGSKSTPINWDQLPVPAHLVIRHPSLNITLYGCIAMVNGEPVLYTFNQSGEWVKSDNTLIEFVLGGYSITTK